MLRSGTSTYGGSIRVSRNLECNASDKPISLSRPVAVLGNLQCEGGQEASLAFTKGENAFRLAKEGHFASSDNAIGANDFFASRLLGILEFGKRKGGTNHLYPLAKASDGLAMTESMESSEQFWETCETETDASRM